MTKTIWKYELKMDRITILSIPSGAEILCVQAQNNKPCLWVQVYPDALNEERVFVTYGTGHPMNEDLGITETYIGTYQLNNGAFVFHVFESDIK